jgi:hypothetical protein
LLTVACKYSFPLFLHTFARHVALLRPIHFFCMQRPYSPIRTTLSPGRRLLQYLISFLVSLQLQHEQNASIHIKKYHFLLFFSISFLSDKTPLNISHFFSHFCYSYNTQTKCLYAGNNPHDVRSVFPRRRQKRVCTFLIFPVFRVACGVAGTVWDLCPKNLPSLLHSPSSLLSPHFTRNCTFRTLTSHHSPPHYIHSSRSPQLLLDSKFIFHDGVLHD